MSQNVAQAKDGKESKVLDFKMVINKKDLLFKNFQSYNKFRNEVMMP